MNHRTEHYSEMTNAEANLRQQTANVIQTTGG